MIPIRASGEPPGLMHHAPAESEIRFTKDIADDPVYRFQLQYFCLTRSGSPALLC